MFEKYKKIKYPDFQAMTFVSDILAVWPDQNLENGSAGGTHCVLWAGGTTEPSSAQRGASGWSLRG